MIELGRGITLGVAVVLVGALRRSRLLEGALIAGQLPGRLSDETSRKAAA